MNITREEKEVVVEFDSKYWGVTYNDGYNRAEGWTDIYSATISDPKYLTKPEDLTYEGSPFIAELKKGTIRSVIRTNIVICVFE